VTEASAETTARGRLSVWLFVAGMAGAGALVGLLAQVLRQNTKTFSGAFMDLGASTAIWLTIGFLLARWIAQTRPPRDRIAWISVVLAAYLFAWLIAYHTLWGIREQLDFAQVWPQMRFWIAAVAPVCVALGLVAVFSLRKDWLGDACLIVPIGWSLRDAYFYGHQGVSEIVVVAIPTLLAALIPAATARRRRWRPLVVAATLLLSGAVFYLLMSRFTLDSSS